MKSYKNKDLIYVDGKAYTEKNLRDMIEYYHQNYKPNIAFPSEWHDDVNSQIFKNYPFYRSISKKHYQPELFYETYCDLDITFKEFLTYVSEEEPEQLMLLMINKYEDVAVQSKVAAIYKEDGQYVYNDHTIDMDEGINTADEYKDTIENMIAFIINEYQDYQTIWYDIKTVKAIYYRRSQCQQFNKNYDQEMIENYFNQLLFNIPKVIDQNTFIIYYSYYLFLLYNITLFKEDIDRLEDFLAYGIPVQDGPMAPDDPLLLDIEKLHPINNIIDDLKQYI